MRQGAMKFYFEEEAKKRPKTMSLKDLRRKAELGTITESEASVLDSRTVRIGARKEGA